MPLANRTRAGRREAACRWHANERRSHLPIRSVLPVCHWQTAPEPAGETAGAAPPFVQRCALHCAQCEAEKGRASQKQRSDFLAAPVHKAPPGRQKSEREFCLFGGVLFVRRAAPYGRLAVLARPAAVMRAFVPGVPAFFPPVCRCLVPGLRLSAVFCLARAAAARRLCAELPAGGPAFCGFVPGPRASPPAGFVRIFAPAAFLPAVRFLAHIFALFWLPVCLFCAMCAGLFSTCFFALS